MLTADMKQLIKEFSIGYVATVNADGTPNLSPKATMVAVDERHIAFGNLRSPQTVNNIVARPAVELNFIDVFARKGYRFRGVAVYVERGESRFVDLLPHFSGWGFALTDHFHGIVVVAVNEARPLISPAYDHGANEETLRAEWKQKYLDA